VRALTLTQPWATLVAIGAKSWETRSWTTGYRGPLAIHASRSLPLRARVLCDTEPFAGALAAAGYRSAAELPLGACVAVANLSDVRPTSSVLSWPVADLQIHEVAFGNYEPGRWMWRLSDVAELKRPIPCKGALGLWSLPDDVEGKIAAVRAVPWEGR